MASDLGSDFRTCVLCGRTVHKACGQIISGDFLCATDALLTRRVQAGLEYQHSLSLDSRLSGYLEPPAQPVVVKSAKSTKKGGSR